MLPTQRLRALRELVRRRQHIDDVLAAQQRLARALDRKIALAILAEEGDDLDERIGALVARLGAFLHQETP